MRPGIAFRRMAALAAMLAIALQALWPLLAQARPAELSLLAPLCTIDGVTHYLEIKAGKSTPLDERSAQHGEHCKLCVFGDGKAVAAPAPDASAFLRLRRADEPVAPPALASYQPPHLLPAQPRAPPANA